MARAARRWPGPAATRSYYVIYCDVAPSPSRTRSLAGSEGPSPTVTLAAASASAIVTAEATSSPPSQTRRRTVTPLVHWQGHCQCKCECKCLWQFGSDMPDSAVSPDSKSLSLSSSRTRTVPLALLSVPDCQWHCHWQSASECLSLRPRVRLGGSARAAQTASGVQLKVCLEIDSEVHWQVAGSASVSLLAGAVLLGLAQAEASTAVHAARRLCQYH